MPAWARCCPYGHTTYEVYPNNPRGKQYYCSQCRKAGREPHFTHPIDLTESDVSRSDLPV